MFAEYGLSSDALNEHVLHRRHHHRVMRRQYGYTCTGFITDLMRGPMKSEWLCGAHNAIDAHTMTLVRVQDGSHLHGISEC